MVSDIFKSYDVRGLYPAELNGQTAFRISRAVVQSTKAKTIVVGRDMRLSGPALHEQIVAGAQQQGAKVFDLGLCSTDLFYFSVWKLKADAGIMITASHNPKQYNGLKITRKNAIVLGSDSGLLEIKKLVEENKFKDAKKRGAVVRKSCLDDFVNFVRGFVDVKKIGALKVVLDAGNGMASEIAPRVFAGLPLNIVLLCFGLDGNFPNHEANPLLERNRKDIIAKVVEEKADLGIAWDGDADRVFFIDNNGEFIRGDFLLALLAKNILQKKKGATILYNAPSTKFIADTIKACGGKPLMCRTGHAFFKAKMKETKAPLGGELSGHYYYSFKDLLADNGMIPALQILELLSTEKKKLSESFSEARKKYFISGEINFTVQEKDAKVKEIEEKFKPSAKKVFYLDGLSMEFGDWWFNLRKSGTEPLLRLNLEANSRQLMEQKRGEISAIIKN